MKSELKVALEMKAKGYRHVIQATVIKNGVREDFGEPIFLKYGQEAGPLLRDIGKEAQIAWSNSIERYIDLFCGHEDKDGKGRYAAGYPATYAICGLTF
jgi:hypothetical protein